MWEEDGGSSSSYNSGYDENHTLLQDTYMLSSFNTGADTLTLSGNGGYHIKLKIELTPTPVSEIAISGNRTEITSGSTSTKTSDSTHLGQVLIGDSQLVSYTIANTGTKSLSLTGSPVVSITGANAGDFSVVKSPNSTISINGQTEFRIKFKPSGIGSRKASISIANDDGDENPYTFTLEGEGACDLQVAGTATDPSCPGSNDGKVKLNITGGTIPYSHGYYALNKTFLGQFSSGDFDSVNMKFNSSGNGLELYPNASQSFFRTKEKFLLDEGAEFNASIFIPDGAYITTMIGFSSGSNSTSGYSKGIYFSARGTGSTDVYAMNNGGGVPFSTGSYSLATGGEWFDIRISMGTSSVELGVKRASESSYTNTKTVSYTPQTENLYLDVYQSKHPTLGYGTTVHKNWRLGVASPDTTSLTQGNYVYIIQDANGCTDTASFSLKDPSSLVANSTIDTAISCYGGNNGGITTSVSGGSQPYTYQWSHSGWGNSHLTTPSIVGLSQGTYYVEITDKNNCTTKDTVVLQDPTPFTVPLISKNVSCYSGKDGEARFAIFYEDFEDAPNQAFSSNTATLPNLKNQWTYHQASAGSGQLVFSNPVGKYHSGNRAAGLHYGGNGNVHSLRATIDLAQYTQTDLKLSFWYYNVGDEDDRDDVVRMRGDTTDNWFTLLDWNHGASSDWEHVVVDLDSALAANGQSISAHTQLSFDETDGFPFPIPTDGVLFDDISIYSPQHSITWTGRNQDWFRDSLSAGTYVATITNPDGCTFIDTVEITEPSLLTTSIQVDSNISCNGKSDAQLHVTATGGTTPYQYQWNDHSSNDTLTSQPAGVYSVTTTDSLGCTAVDTQVVNQPKTLTASISVDQHVSCYGKSDGQATVTPDGGTAPYSYKWSNGDKDTTAKNLAKGSYSVTVTDKNGCQVTQSVNITEPNLFSASAQVDQVLSCYGDTNGEASVTVSGGTASYTYKWSHSAWGNTQATTSSITGLSQGVYYVEVTDKNSCIARDTLVLQSPAQFTVPVISKNVSCYGGNDGEARFAIFYEDFEDAPNQAFSSNTTTLPNLKNHWTYHQASAGSGQLVFSNPVGKYHSGNRAAGLQYGGHGNVHSLRATIDLAQYTQTDLKLSFWYYNVGDEDDRDDVVRMRGDTSDSWFTILDWNDGTSSDWEHAIIDIDSALAANGQSISARTQLSFDETDGTPFALPTDGVLFDDVSIYSPQHSIAWAGRNQDWFRDSLSQGTYVATVTNQDGCTFTDTVKITQPSLLTTSIQLDSSVSCNGKSDAQLSVSATGGTTPYQYQWNNHSSNDTLTSQPAGVYSVTTTDSLGCTAVDTQVVNQPKTLTASILVDQHASCYGNSDGQATVTPGGGTAPYSYKWSNGDTDTSAKNLAKGTYSVTITDKNGCQATQPVSITEPNNLSASAQVDQANSCYGGNNGVASVSVSGGTSPYTYQWSNRATGQKQTGLSAGGYGIKVTDKNGCVDSTTVQITEPNALKPGVIGNVSSICVNEAPSRIDQTTKASGGTPNYTYQWQKSTDGNSFTDISGAQSATYQPGQLAQTTWYRRLVDDSENCGPATSNVVKVVVNPLPVARFSTSDKCFVDSMSFTDGSSVSSGSIAGWAWKFGDGNTSNAQHPKHLYATAGRYPSQLVVTTQAGCYDTLSELLIVNPRPVASINAQNACEYQAVSFASKSVIGNQGQIASTQWALGDGTSSSSTSFQHTYSSAGSYTIKLVVTSDSGCVDSTMQTLYIHPQPQAGFKTPQNCFYGPSAFTNTSSLTQGTLAKYAWTFGDGKNSTQTSPVHSYASPGAYTVTLVATSDSGCVDTTLQIVYLNPKPTAAFAVNDTCIYKSFDFANKTTLSSGAIASHAWNFGDGKTSSSVSPTHSYGTAGSYSAKLIVVSDSGCSDTFSQTVTAHARPSAQFSASAVCHENFTEFTDASSVSNSSIAQWLWDFGDGSTSTAQNPKNRYQKPGTYTAKLIATSAYGCVDTVTSSTKVHPKPAAKFTAAIACEDEQVQFIDSSKVSSGQIKAYGWDFGNVSTSSQQNPINVYKDTGFYQTALVVTTDQGCKDTFTQLLEVNPVPTSKFSVSNVCVSDKANFSNLSSISRGSMYYRWSLGDSTQSTATQPKHQYPFSGFYQVQLSVVSDKGCADSTSQTLQIYALPSVQFSAQDVCDGETVSFSNSSKNTQTFGWNLGDGNTSTTSNPQHSYATNGQYNVKLVGTSAKGCKDSVQKQITVHALPAPAFSTNTACLTDTTRFTNSSTNSTGFAWNLGDGSSSVLTSPKHRYGQSGNYTVQLVATSADGCKDTLQKNTLVNALPQVAFATQDVCDGNTVAFANQSSGATTHQWTFGDGNNSSSIHPNHTYAGPGSFAVRLISTTSAGCSDSSKGNVEVFANPVANFSQNHVCDGSVMDFTNQSTLVKGLATYHWEFGDQSTSNNVSPSHLYASSGAYTVKLVATSDKGCKDSTNQIASVYSMPLPSFTATSVCEEETTSFTNTSTGAVSYLWSLGDGQTASGTSINHLYQKDGEYQVQLVAFTSNNCRDSVSQLVSVWRKPVAAFVHDSVCEGSDLLFTHTSSQGPIDAFEWSFGDGSKSGVANPQHQYGSSGSYSVELIVTTDKGCKDTASSTAQVHPNPVVAFSGNDICAYDTLQLTNLTTISSGSVASYNWNLGDGTTHIGTQANKWYEKPGSYAVRLTATSDHGCLSAHDSLFEVFELPVASFVAGAVCDGLPTQFNNQSLVRSGSVVQNDWDFGDGALSSLTFPSHVYATDGTYDAQLIVTSNHGCVDTVEQTVTVHRKPLAGFNATAVCNNASTEFSNTSQDAQQWFWNFGDNEGSSVLENPNYEYLNPGTYNTSLRVVSARGCEDTLIQAVEVYALPTANFTVLNHCLNDELAPADASIGNIDEWNWKFGDGTQVDGSAPTHTYSADGEYLVGLLITDDHGCQDSVERKVVVHPLPVPDIHGDTLVSKGYTVKLWASGGDSYQWFPSEGLSNSDVQLPVAVVTEDQTYTVTVTTAYGCAKDTFVNLRAREDYTLEPSNVMTPDGNGQNDQWVVEKAIYYDDVEVVVFDRWGRIVYQSKAYQNNWDGTVNGKPLPDGAYFYVIKVPHERESYKGSLTIFR